MYKLCRIGIWNSYFFVELIFRNCTYTKDFQLISSYIFVTLRDHTKTSYYCSPYSHIHTYYLKDYLALYFDQLWAWTLNTWSQNRISCSVFKWCTVSCIIFNYNIQDTIDYWYDYVLPTLLTTYCTVLLYYCTTVLLYCTTCTNVLISSCWQLLVIE